jgi:hypothetical protein
MTVYASFNPTALRAGDFPMISRPVTILTGQNLKRGAVLGVVTASGKYVLSASAAGDGSQTPKAILAADVDTTTVAGDQVAPAYFTGEFGDLMMTFGTGHTQATVDAAFAASGQPIFIRKLGVAP